MCAFVSGMSRKCADERITEDFSLKSKVTAWGEYMYMEIGKIDTIPNGCFCNVQLHSVFFFKIIKKRKKNGKACYQI